MYHIWYSTPIMHHAGSRDYRIDTKADAIYVLKWLRKEYFLSALYS